MGINSRKKSDKNGAYIIHYHDTKKSEAMLWFLISEDVGKRFNGRKEDSELWQLACAELNREIVECFKNHGINLSDILKDFEEFKE